MAPRFTEAATKQPVEQWRGQRVATDVVFEAYAHAVVVRRLTQLQHSMDLGQEEAHSPDRVGG